MSIHPYDREQLVQGLFADYRREYPRSESAHTRAIRVLVDGISHGARTFSPYPFRIASAQGATVTDLDGHEIVDFWQGHYANILGHNPVVVRERLVAALEQGSGLQTGIPDELQTTFAETLIGAVGAESVRLTTSGTLATMYAIMLARAHTRRKVVVKVAGGWHGANPLALKGVGRSATGFDKVDSVGVPPSTAEEIIVTPFNDVEALEQVFRADGDRVACFIFEPCPGRNGFIPASPEFMTRARALTEKHGALLILDEVITGFRFCASGVQRLYGVRPDLSTYGKVIGGGMPIAAVAGRADVLALAAEDSQRRVWFNGGTFSAHPLSMIAGQTMLDYLIAHETEIYPALGNMGEKLRWGIEQAFEDRGVFARCTGFVDGPIPSSSLFAIYFPLSQGYHPMSIEGLTDPKACDVFLADVPLKLGLLLGQVNTVHGTGALATSHTDEHLSQVFEACDQLARRLTS